MNKFICLAMLFSGFTMIGCNGNSDAPELAIVEGIVTWNGKPLGNAGVAFTPESGPIAIGQTDEKGHFTLSTQGRPGAKIGPHRVTIDAYESAPGGTGNGIDSNRPVALVSRIPAKFSELSDSGLVSQVSERADQNKFEFHLK